MTTNTHTRGPWNKHLLNHGPNIAKIKDASENVPSIATIHNAAGRGEANARLIEWAPDLLEALQDMADEHAGTESGDKADELIAKVTGGAA